MKHFITPFILILFVLSVLCSAGVYGQQHTLHAKNGMNATPRNYTWFTSPFKDAGEEVVQNNKGYEHHPELGMLFAGTPCDNCYELIGCRTATSKTFVKEGTGGKDIMQQTAGMPMHYKDAQGNWLTIQTKLAPAAGNAQGTFAASAQETPVVISPRQHMVSLGSGDQLFRFNNGLELVYAKPDGSQQLLGTADYSHYSAGDDGVYITNAWPGIDIEMYVARGAVKTNYIINSAMPAYAAGKLLVRDHFGLNKGWAVDAPGGKQGNYKGNLEIKNNNDEVIYLISPATAYEKKASASSLQMLEYGIAGNVLDIALPGNFLNRPASSYPVIIDPLVSAAASYSISTGSEYSTGWTAGCAYPVAASVPAGIAVTDVQFTFSYTTGGGAHILNGANDFHVGTCRSPSVPTQYWTCTDTGVGTCNEIGVTIFPEIYSCIPAPQCTAYSLPVLMNFYQNYAPTFIPCSPSYIAALGDLTITVFGHRVDSVTVTSSPATVCQGQSATLTASSLYGIAPFTYSWAPGSLAGAAVTVNPTTTTVYTLTTSDACGNSSVRTYTVTVNPIGPILGTPTVCFGGTTTLSDIAGPGTWVSSNPSLAPVGSATGVVTGVHTGSVAISYTSLAGCVAMPVTVTVKPAVSPIAGSDVICQGSTTTLSDATAGGTWSSSSSSIVSVSGGSGIGVATGVSGGTAVITYATTGGGCYATKSLTINPLSPITGTASLCLGATTTLSDASPGGTWSSSNVAVATIGTATGVVSSLAAGVSVITYLLPTGCSATRSVTVNVLSPITGTMVICQGGSTTLSHPVPGGTWTSAIPSVAAINAITGLISGIAGGTAVISYTLPGGCSATTVMTINPLPFISGTASVCLGGTTALSGSTTGTWASSNYAIATVGATSGLVTGAGLGSCTISFTSSAGCTGTTPVTVSLPMPITGAAPVCPGGTVVLSNSTPGGTWASANTSIATVGASSGIVTGVSGGTVVISYTNPSGCTNTVSIAVNTISPITGVSAICTGGSATLSNAISPGSWSSSNPDIATIDSFSGVVSGLAGGTVSISYSTLSGCVATTTFVVNVPLPITGAASICLGNTSVLSNIVAGGTWASVSPAIATIGSSTGLVASIAVGTSVVNYITPAGCNSSVTVTVNPVAPVTGASSVCAGASITLSNAIAGGSWMSTMPAIASIDAASGVMTGVSAGIATISYTTLAGCTSSFIVTVNASPAPISGSTLLCATTTLTDAVPGGSWTSANPSIATIGVSSGVAFGLAPGAVTITYSLSGGCFTTTTLTVDPLLPISGTPVVCMGSTTALGYPAPGGTWSSLAPAIASVGSATGLVAGVAAGTTTISYTTSSGCIATVFVTVHPLSPIAGLPAICQGSNATLFDAIAGGSWSTSDAAVVPVGATTGIISGAAVGSATVSYTTSSGCVATLLVAVNAINPTTGIPVICVGNTTTLSNTTPGGGAWNSFVPSIATVGAATGLVTGIAGGTANIRFTSSSGCTADFIETINPLPSPIIGALSVCMGSTSSLTNSLPGGIWSSSDISVATVGSATGVLTGVAVNTVTITYTSAAGCAMSGVVTVNPLPSAITGVAVFCQGSATTLYDVTTTGTWTSLDPAIATVGGGTGIVSGITAGSTFIRFTTPAGCFVSRQVTINALPAPITGTTVLCQGAASTLANTLAGGTWNSTDPTSASIGALSGVLTGLASGTATITYITAAGCYATVSATVNATPAISGYSFTNPTTCTNIDGAVTLNGLAPGASYTVNYTFGSAPVAITLTATGSGEIIISGLAAGSYANFSVTTPLGCTSNVIAGPVMLVLPATPATPVVSNNTPLCAGVTVDLTATDATAGVTYSWSGPGGYSSTLQSPALVASTVAQSGVYTVTATKLACVSALATTTVVVHPVPAIAQINSGNPTTCSGNDGVFVLSGLLPGVSYSVTYLFDGTGATLTEVADTSGKIEVAGLKAGSYSSITVNSFTCISNVVGPVILHDPNPPQTPVLWSNSPICAGKTLSITSADATNGLTYDWKGPGGYSSSDQDQVIPNISVTDSGLYTLTVKHLNCAAVAAIDIQVHPSVILTNVTQSQTVPQGGSIRLYAGGAELYLWLPNDGSLSDPSIDSPVVTPQGTTVYTVQGTNSWGCPDTATVNINVDDNVTEYIPNAFTPNNDGRNDIFRIVNSRYDKLVEFVVYNRWGQQVYHNDYEISEGWNGKWNGVEQDMGTYYYLIILTRPDGNTKTFKGEVILMR